MLVTEAGRGAASPEAVGDELAIPVVTIGAAGIKHEHAHLERDERRQEGVQASVA